MLNGMEDDSVVKENLFQATIVAFCGRWRKTYVKAQISFQQDTFRINDTNLLDNKSKCVAVTIKYLLWIVPFFRAFWP